jgi:hypothetical protein
MAANGADVDRRQLLWRAPVSGSNRYRMSAGIQEAPMDESSVSRQSEPSYVAWMRARAQDARRHQPVIAQRHAQADGSEGPEVHGQEVAWVERHALERRLHDSAMAHLRHG